jgi:hypothetical protein
MLCAVQTFHLFAAHYFLGGPRPGLPHALNSSFGVGGYPRTPFNVFRYDAFAARQSAAVRCAKRLFWAISISFNTNENDLLTTTGGSGQAQEKLVNKRCFAQGYAIQALGWLLEDGCGAVLAE